MRGASHGDTNGYGVLYRAIIVNGPMSVQMKVDHGAGMITSLQSVSPSLLSLSKMKKM
jgi:hypothetical protein